MNERNKQIHTRNKIKSKLQLIFFFISLIIFFFTLFYFINFVKNWKEERKELLDYIKNNKINAVLNELSNEEDLSSYSTNNSEIIKIILTPEEQFDLQIDRKIHDMSLSEKVAGLFFLTPENLTGVKTSTQAGNATKYALEQYPIGGIIYFEKNIQSAEQISKMIDNSKKYCKYPLFIGIEEEGGSISQISKAELTETFPSAAEIGSSGNIKEAYTVGTQIGVSLFNLGFNVNFAPVVDIASIEQSIMKDRSYGNNAKIVSYYAISMMNGLHDSNIISCLKHFPGIGSSINNSNEYPIIIEKSAIELRTEEFQVFKAGIKSGVNMIMVSHALVPALDENNIPSFLSKTIVTDILRKELKFEGIIITDYLNVPSLTNLYNSKEIAISALNAGCDMLLNPENFKEAHEGIVDAVLNGTIPEKQIDESLKRIYRVKYKNLKK